MALETVKEGNVVTALADTVALPRMVKVRQKLDHTNVPREEIPEKVRQELLQCGMAQRIHKGNSIAITCGSRGVANIAKIINSNPQVVFISTFGPTQPLIAKQLRQFGYNGLCFTKDLYQVDALNVAGAASNGIAFVYPYLTYSSVDECDDAFIKDFLTAYEAEYGTLPVSDCAYRAYDSMLVEGRLRGCRQQRRRGGRQGCWHSVRCSDPGRSAGLHHRRRRRPARVQYLRHRRREVHDLE